MNHVVASATAAFPAASNTVAVTLWLPCLDTFTVLHTDHITPPVLTACAFVNTTTTSSPSVTVRFTVTGDASVTVTHTRCVATLL